MIAFGGVKRFDTFAKWTSGAVHILGYCLMGIACVMLPCMIADILSGSPAMTFLVPILLAFAVGIALTVLFRMPAVMKPIESLFSIGLIWLGMFVIGALPFLMYGTSPIDSVFESVSGFTTTGASIYSDISSLPDGILLWRSLMNWVGGIIVIMMFMFLLPMIGYGSRSIMSNEMAGSGGKNFSARIKDAAKQFVFVYLGLTAVLVVLLLIGGAGTLESLCISFSCISTGGFMCTNDSLAGFSVYVKIVTMIFMILGATNFYLHYRAVYQKKASVYLGNTEFKTFMAMFCIFAVALPVFMWFNDYYVGAESIVDQLFTLTSMMTTTGFSSVDYTFWPLAPVMLGMFLMLIGGCSGSTAGGIKISRMIILARYLKNTVYHLVHPLAVYDVKYNGESLDNDTVNAAISVAMLFVLTTAIGTVVIMFFGIDVLESLSICIGCLTSYGPALGVYGPMGSYATAPDAVKIVMSLIMWFGRLEIATALVLFSPGFWREFIISRNKVVERKISPFRR